MFSLHTLVGRSRRLLLSATLISCALSTSATADISDPPLLANLQLQSGGGSIGFAPVTLSPAFDSGTLEYHINIPFEHDDVRIALATPVDDFEHIVEEPTIPPLLAGNTTPFEIRVSDFFSMGAATVYTINVTRGASNNIAVLSNLVTSGSPISPSFGQLNFNYITSVPGNTTSITISPTAQSESSTITVDGTPVASGYPCTIDNLPAGVTQVVILVADGDVTKAYTIDISRLQSTLDDDNDGIPDDFETANALTVGVNDAALDLDGDGLSNLGEYAFGSDPNDASDHNDPVVTRKAGGFIVVTFHRAIGPADGSYQVQVSSDLETWTSDLADLTNPSTPETQVWRDTHGGSPTAPAVRFVRVLFTSTL